MEAGVFEAMTQDLRRVLRVLSGRHEEPSAAIFDGRTLQCPPRAAAGPGTTGPSGARAARLAVDTLGHLLALRVTAADEQDRRQVAKLAADVQAATGDSVELAFVDQGYTGERPAAEAKNKGIELSVVKLPEAKRGFVLLPRRWVSMRHGDLGRASLVSSEDRVQLAGRHVHLCGVTEFGESTKCAGLA